MKSVSEHAGADEPILVGWSLGGHIALEALTVMDGIAGVVVFGTPPLGVPPAMDEAFLPNPAMDVGFSEDVDREQARTYASAFFAPGATIDLEPFVEDILATDGAARVGLGASVGTVNYADEVQLVGGMTQPLAILHGPAEQLVSGQYLDGLHAPTLWRGAVQLIDGTGHAPHQEDPAAFNDLVEAFIRDLG